MIAEHPTLLEAFDLNDRVNNPVDTRLSGRITRSITSALLH